MKPTVGNYSLHLPKATLAGQYHPLDGKGTLIDAGTTPNAPPVACFVSAVEETVITSVHVPNSSSGANELDFYHGNGALAFKCRVNQTNSGKNFWEIPGDGMLLTGAWWVDIVTSGADDDWTIFFKVVS